jgi:hypothetical protein
MRASLANDASATYPPFTQFIPDHLDPGGSLRAAGTGASGGGLESVGIGAMATDDLPIWGVLGGPAV